MKKILLPVFIYLLQFNFCYSQKIETTLTFVYWMPYDNNLSYWADTVYQMIQSGIKSDDIIVTIQKDVAEDDGMTRSIISNDDIKNYHVTDERSYSGETFNNYLLWVSDRIKSDKYVIIFLDHGGKLDEIGLDEFPEERFLRIDSARLAINNFNRANGKKTELVFLQVCTKGSVEAIYEFKDVAKYTMFSQTILGAPNFYYTSFFKSLSNSNMANLSGADLANKIVDFERDDMYSSLVCVDNSHFDAFELELNRFLTDFSNLHQYDINQNLPLFYYGQHYWDLVSFINSFEGAADVRLLEAIDRLVVMNKINPNNESMKEYAGLSILAMNKTYLELIEQYDHLQFFNTFNTKEFYKKAKALLKK